MTDLAWVHQLMQPVARFDPPEMFVRRLSVAFGEAFVLNQMDGKRLLRDVHQVQFFESNLQIEQLALDVGCQLLHLGELG
ncbi:hypothetical protein TM49_11970 [Martelella endophytica]|uniref:Uncharacterized protein n=1 Tax=Martelella endophytica TaxID=1486262 RepID=A0A0D5LR36_MAREN|nr:hypothetical protein TM49_11970 [Martelella endophytica]